MSELPAFALFLYVASTMQKSLWDYISNYLHSSSLQLEASKIYTAESPGVVGYFIVAETLFKI
jgi:hypothetical protein